MKLYFLFSEGPAASHMKQSMKLKKKWRSGPTINVKEVFVENYNAKHPDTPLAIDAVHLVNREGVRRRERYTERVKEPYPVHPVRPLSCGLCVSSLYEY